MNKFKVYGDPNTRPYGSASIIINETNNAAKELGLYDENGIQVCYDTLCNPHGGNPSAFWCAFELAFPIYVMNSANGKPILGLSQDNAFAAILGGYPRNLVNFVNLGVNRNIWKPITKSHMMDKFVFGACIESTVRSDIPIMIQAFGECFRGNRDVVFYLKDREATPLFKSYVKEKALEYDVEIIHDDSHIEDFNKTREIMACFDVFWYLNHAGTFCMTIMEAMASGIPVIASKFSGPNTYGTHEFNMLAVDYKVSKITQERVNGLVNIGMKNHLFPMNGQNYLYPPVWAEFNLESVKASLIRMKDESELRSFIAQNGLITSEWFSWHRTANDMSFILDRLPTQSLDVTLQ